MGIIQIISLWPGPHVGEHHHAGKQNKNSLRKHALVWMGIPVRLSLLCQQWLATMTKGTATQVSEKLTFKGTPHFTVAGQLSTVAIFTHP